MSWKFWAAERQIIEDYYQGTSYERPAIAVSTCGSCNESMVWYRGRVIFPFNNVGYLGNISDVVPQPMRGMLESAVLCAAHDAGSAAMLIRHAVYDFCEGQIEAASGEPAQSVVAATASSTPAVRDACIVFGLVGEHAVPRGVRVEDDRVAVVALLRLAEQIAADVLRGTTRLEMYIDRITAQGEPQAHRQSDEIVDLMQRRWFGLDKDGHEEMCDMFRFIRRPGHDPVQNPFGDAQL